MHWPSRCRWRASCVVIAPKHIVSNRINAPFCRRSNALARDKPVLIRIESKAGHGAGKPTSKRIDEATDMYAFLFQNIGVPYRPVAERK